MPALLAPALFVLMWSTGWVVAKLATPHAGPLTFLTVRYAAALMLLAPVALLSGARWPRGSAQWGGALVNGMMLHALYLGGVWWAIAHGVPAGVSALIAALQPLLTVVVAGPLLGERLSGRRWLGVGLGFLGVAAVVAPKLAAADGLEPALLPLGVNVLAMAAVAAATLHQKRSLGGQDLRTLAALQYAGAIVLTAPAAWLAEDLRVDWTPSAILALAWSVLVLSIGAILLMLAMIKRGDVSRVATLIFLVPPVAALEAFLLFGETLSAVQLLGMALAAVGVVLANVAGAPASAEGCIAAAARDDEDAAETLRRPA